MKKRIDIEALIRWTYRDELPKAQVHGVMGPDGFGFAWGGVARYGKYMADPQEPDIRNRYGVVPDLTSSSYPHDDAIAVWHAVQDLDTLDHDRPEDWNPLGDMGDLGPLGAAATARGLRKLTLKRWPVSELVRHAAILSPPDWRAEIPVKRDQAHSNGKPIWFIRECINGQEIETTNGLDPKRRIPKAGAYRKPYLDPDPVDAVVARAEYQMWLAALAMLTENLTGRLDAHEPVNSDRPAWPWEEGALPLPAILIDNRPIQPFIRESRPLAGPPPMRGRHAETMTAICPHCGQARDIDRADFRRSRQALTCDCILTIVPHG